MFLLSISRSIVFAFQSFFRNIWLSVATIFIVFLALLSVNFLIGIQAVSESAVNLVKDKIDVSVYFKQSVRDDKINEVKSHLEVLPQVKEVVYFSPDQNLASFKDRHSADQSIQESLSELDSNPLGATLVVTAKELADYPTVLKAIDDPSYSDLIEKKNFNDNQTVITKINSITETIRKVGLIISLLFVIISALIIYNTIRIAIFTHQNEIGIMKLVGASNWFIRLPFVFESMISGLLACALSIGAVYLALYFIQPNLASFFGGASFDVAGYFNRNMIIIFGSQFLGIVIVNIIASTVALNKYLKV